MWQLRNKFSMNKTHSTVLNRLSGVQIWTGQSGNQRDRTGKIYPVPDNIVSINFLWPPCGIGQAIIFLSCGFFLYIVFSSPILSGQRLDVYHTFTHDVALVRVATVWLRVNLRTFQGLSITFSRPIPAMYHIRQCLSYDMKTLPHRNHFTALFLAPPRWAGARRELLDIMVQGKINRGRHTNHPAGRHSIRTNQCPPPPYSHIFYRPDALPAAQPTAPKHWRQLVHLH